MIECGILVPVLSLMVPTILGMSTNFVNPDMPYMRPTFVVNFDISTVICQLSANEFDIHVFNISILCDGYKHCYNNPAIHDESFPLCNGGCAHSCGDHGTCLNDGQFAHCFCDSGYHGNACQANDSNECEENPCSSFATCTNTLGSYYCTCLPGYTGNGYRCSDIDECSEGLSMCPDHSICVNLPGTYYCNCTDGYIPTGVPFHTCVDVDECYFGLGDCDNFGEKLMCQNRIGSYSCTTECSKGFEYLDDKTCMDINECNFSELEANPCGRRSICENKPGYFTCRCEEGFEGDGLTCDPIGDCSINPDICDANAFCLSALKMCFCQKGYIGDGITCLDIDECSEQTFPCTHEEDYCVNVPGTFLCCGPSVNETQCKKDFGFECLNCAIDAICKEGECVCKQGLQGNPYKRCHVGESRSISFSNDFKEISCGRDAILSKFLSICVCLPGFFSWKNGTGCLDIDECEDDTAVCANDEWCANTHGSYLCCGVEDLAVPCLKAKENRKVITERPFIYHGNGPRAPYETTTLSTHEIFGLEYSGENAASGSALFCGNMVCGSNAICIGGECRCIAGYSGQPTVSCYDVNECIVPGEMEVCPEEGSWCVNTLGAYYCCNPGTKSVDCIGLVIEAKHLSKGSKEDENAIPQNESGTKGMIQKTGSESRPSSYFEKITPLEENSQPYPHPPSPPTEIQTEVPRLPWKVNPLIEEEYFGPTITTPVKNIYFGTVRSSTIDPGNNYNIRTEDTEKFSGAIPPLDIPGSDGRNSVYSGAKTPEAVQTEREHAGCVSNDECGLDAVCERRSGVCRCRAGFVGNPPNENCEDADECSLNLHDCHRSSICRNHLGGYNCQCPQGHRPIGRICIDINECTERNPCHQQAICTNLPGSVECACPPGLFGDGYNCHKLNESFCTSSQHNSAACFEHQECFSTNGQVQCGQCKPGFHLEDNGCQDINECETDEKFVCGDSSHCQNTEGGYYCECDLGYIGDGQLCIDMDECREEGHCHPQATCLNTQGGYICQCPRGWKGDGIQLCYDPQSNACEGEPCSPNSVCLSVGDGNVCQCKWGYAYVRELQLCQDMNECSEGRDQCNPMSTCINTDGSYQCRCKEGYRGSGQWCSDINECSEGISKCDFNAICTNLIGGYECRCPNGLDGDGYTCKIPVNDACPIQKLMVCQKVNKKCELDGNVWYCGECLNGYKEVTDSFLKAIDPTDRCADIDECENPDHGCHQHAVCYNLPGSFRCRCRPGYTGDGEECWLGLPGSDCSDPTKNDCDQNADCIDVELGRHFCSCREGFIGDGVRCDDVDECFLPHLCSEDATCINTPGSYACTCNDGYHGDGMLCSALCTGGGRPDTSSEPCDNNSDTCAIGFECRNRLCCPVPEPTNCAFNTSLCHQNAQCLTGRCVCEPGFRGDGLVCFPFLTIGYATITTSTTQMQETVSSAVPTSSPLDVAGNQYGIKKLMICGNKTCHPFADCLSSKKCHCWPNFVGDGEKNCKPDPDDCVFDSRLCGKDAVCRLPERRCICVDGQKTDRFGNCIQSFTQTVPTTTKEVVTYNQKKPDCLYGNCNPKADDGAKTCADDPSICNQFAYCSKSKCICKSDYIGDGVICHKRHQSKPVDEFYSSKKTKIFSKVCNGRTCGKNAECLVVAYGGECRCNEGFRGDGVDCEDINECADNKDKCAEHAVCVNSLGSYGCVCDNGYKGDGYTYCITDLNEAEDIDVACDNDGLALVMRHSKGFKGQIFVQSQSKNPFCSKVYTVDQGPIYKFKANFAHCDIKKEEKSTYATTVVVQQHPLFVTDEADVYHLRCSYPTGSKSVMGHFNVSDIPFETMDGTAPNPTCDLQVTNADTGDIIKEAVVGQRLQIQLTAIPDMFGVLPSNCLAVNMDQGETYALTDEVGCAIEADIFPEWLSIADNIVYAQFKTFKWPDSTHLRFQCDCAACLHKCEKIDCKKRRQQQQVSSLPYGGRRKRRSSTAVNIQGPPTFSPVVTIKDSPQESEAQQELEQWIYGKSSSSNSTPERDICIPVMTLGLLLAVFTCLASTLVFIGATYFCSNRKPLNAPPNSSETAVVKGHSYLRSNFLGLLKRCKGQNPTICEDVVNSNNSNSTASLLEGFRKCGDRLT